MRIKVHDGTVNHGDRPLCATCTHSTIILGETLDQRIIECRAGIMQALRDVVEVAQTRPMSKLKAWRLVRIVQKARA
jgi:hypothetical protein